MLRTSEHGEIQLNIVTIALLLGNKGDVLNFFTYSRIS